MAVGDILVVVAAGIDELARPAEPVEPPLVPFYDALPDGLVTYPPPAATTAFR